MNWRVARMTMEENSGEIEDTIHQNSPRFLTMRSITWRITQRAYGDLIDY
jgi:hypothetical protein